MAFASEESRVLLLYTGGTIGLCVPFLCWVSRLKFAIGMLTSDAGYTPEPFFLFETLRSQTSRFHDPLGDSLLSKGRSVEGFRAWSENQSREQSRSRATSPQRTGRGAPTTPLSVDSLNPTTMTRVQKRDPSIASARTPAIHEVLKEHSRRQSSDGEPGDSIMDPPHSPLEITSGLLVRSTRPVQVPPHLGDDDEGGSRGRSLAKCKKIRDNCYEAALPSLVTPVLSTAPGGNVKRIRYVILEVQQYSLVVYPMTDDCSGARFWIAVTWRLWTGSVSPKRLSSTIISLMVLLSCTERTLCATAQAR